RAGHGVWFILGPRTDPTFVQDSLAQAGLFQVAAKPETKQNSDGSSLSVIDTHNVMLERLSTPVNMTASIKAFKWWSLKPADLGHNVLMSVTNSDDPFSIDCPLGPNGGCVVVWTSPVDGSWNNWPSEKVFAPLVNETLYHLAAGQVKGMENRKIESGNPITWV